MAQTRIANILWRNNSPYGTFNSGDSVDIYWDDSASAFIVKNNTVTITSGNQIPIVFRHNGNSEAFYKTEQYYESLICSGDNKIIFERRSAFPYFNQITLFDHPSCIGTPQVCDLAFTSLANITNCSSETATDGAFTVSATGTNPVKYRLNQDFEYNDGNGQVSGTFTGLTRGNYLVFARDSVNCLSVLGVTIGISYTYGVKLQLTYYSIHTGFRHKTEILEKNYSGQVSVFKGVEKRPCEYNLRGEGERDKFVPILAGELIINILSESANQYSDLYTNDPEKFRSRHSIDVGSGFNTVFVGKVLPNQSTESLKTPKSDVQIIATDGLPSLQDFDFLDGEGNRLVGDHKQITIIAFILNKIGLGLSIRSGCNIYATGMSTAATDDPLDQAYVDVMRYYLKDETPNCWTVLQWILEPYGAQIIQYNNAWNIIRLEERVNDFDYREYNSNGVYVTNGNYNPIRDLKGSGYGNRLVWADQSQTLRVNPGFGTIRLLYDLGRKDNILINGDFSLRQTSTFQNAINIGWGQTLAAGFYRQIAPDTSGFELVSNGNIVTRAWETVKDESVALTFSSSGRLSYFLSKNVFVKMGNADRIKLTYVFAVTPAAYVSYPYIKVKIMVTYGDYYLLDDGTWSTIESSISYFVKPESFYQYQTLEVIGDAPVSGSSVGDFLNVRAFIPYFLDYDFANITLLKASPTTTLKEGYRVSVFYTATNTQLYYELKRTTDTDNDYHIVRPDDYTVGFNPYQWILVHRHSDIIIGNDVQTLKIDKIQIQFLNQGKLLPETAAYEQAMENENTIPLTKIIYHGSLTQTIRTNQNFGIRENAEGGFLDDLMLALTKGYNWKFLAEFSTELSDSYYTGFLKNATGGGYTTWFRDNHAGLDDLQNIYMDMYSAQYNKPWRTINGDFIADVNFAPIDVMRDTQNSNKRYYPIALSINYKMDEYSAQFHELTSVDDADIDLDEPVDDGQAFTTGFSIGFKA